MSEKKILLEPDKFCHIFNRGINSMDIFFENDNYEHFRRLYDKYIGSIADTYAKAINKRFGRTGALLESNFHRKPIEDIEYFKNVVIYIHNNPVHHRICKQPIDYPWSSYLSCMSLKSTKLKRDKVIGWFDNKANFKLLNNDESFDFAKINNFLFIGKKLKNL